MGKSAESTEGYSSAATCAALGLTRTTYDAWMLRGYLKLPVGPGTGRSRLLDLTTVIGLAIMAELVSLGISPSSAGMVAGVVKFPVTVENQVLVIPRFGVAQVTSWRAIEEDPHLSIRAILHASNAYQGLKEPYDDPETKLQPASVIILDVLVIMERVRRALSRILNANDSP